MSIGGRIDSNRFNINIVECKSYLLYHVYVNLFVGFNINIVECKSRSQIGAIDVEWVLI